VEIIAKNPLSYLLIVDQFDEVLSLIIHVHFSFSISVNSELLKVFCYIMFPPPFDIIVSFTAMSQSE
jgi:hypothetical protein